jgi:hypothetical protein
MYSPDGRWWWNGTQWVPVGPAQAYRTRYEESPWTRKLQIAVLALQALGLVVAAIVGPTVMSQVFTNSPAFNDPTFRSDPQMAAFMQNMVTTSLVAGVAISLIVLAAVVIGVIQLWRWLYWYLMISYFLAILAIPGDLTYAFGNGPIRLPAWLLLVQIPAALAQLGIAIWMAVALRRYGTWARRKIVEPA